MIKKSWMILACSMAISQNYAASAKDLDFDFYGFLKTSYITADQKVESYGANGVGAITQAAIIDETNAATKKSDEERRFAFQAQQSRFGFKIRNGKDVTARLEFDFIDFGASAPSPDYDIRIRIAMLDWQINENLKFQGGQKWVSAMGVLPHTYNFVQSGFFSGNTGFISQEMALKYTMGAIDITGAISSRGRNQGNGGVTENERGFLPALTMRVDYNHGAGLIGASFMGAKLEGESDPNNTANTYHDGNAYIGKVYGSYKTSSFNLRAEYFSGQNTGDLFMLATEGASFTSSTGQNIRVSGGFLSAKVSLSEKNSLYAGYGMVETKDGERFVTANTMVANNVITAGFDHKASAGFTTFLELQSFDTEYHVGSLAKKSYDAMTIETGLVYKF